MHILKAITIRSFYLVTHIDVDPIRVHCIEALEIGQIRSVPDIWSGLVRSVPDPEDIWSVLVHLCIDYNQQYNRLPIVITI